MRTATCLLGLGLLLGASGAAFAKPAYVPSTVNLRAAPGTTNEIVAKIPGGSLVEAGECTDGWCAVTFQDKVGFAIQTGLDLSGRVPQRRAAGPKGPPPGYVDGPDYVEGPAYVVGPPPAVYYGPRRYYGPAYYPRYWGPYRRWY
jgi:hypothetical protein